MPSSPPGEPKFWPRTPPDFLLLSHSPERNVKISRPGFGKQLGPLNFPLSRHLPAPRHPFPLLQPPTHTSVAHFYPLKKKNSDDVSLRKALGLHLLMWNHPWETRAPRVTVTSRRIGPLSRLPALRPSLLARVSAVSARERRPSLAARGPGFPAPALEAGPGRSVGPQLPRGLWNQGRHTEGWWVHFSALLTSWRNAGTVGVIRRALMEDSRPPSQRKFGGGGGGEPQPNFKSNWIQGSYTSRPGGVWAFAFIRLNTFSGNQTHFKHQQLETKKPSARRVLKSLTISKWVISRVSHYHSQPVKKESHFVGSKRRWFPDAWDS